MRHAVRSGPQRRLDEAGHREPHAHRPPSLPRPPRAARRPLRRLGSGRATSPAGSRCSLDDFPPTSPRGRWTGCDARHGRCSGLPTAVTGQVVGSRRLEGHVQARHLHALGRSTRSPAACCACGCETRAARQGQRPPAAPPGGNDQLYGRYAIRWKADSVARLQGGLAALARLRGMAPRRGDRLPRGQPRQHDQRLHAPPGRHARAATRTSTAPTSASATGTGTPPSPSGCPGSLRFFLDGVGDRPLHLRVPNTPMHWVIQSETGLGSAHPAAGSEANIYIDWVAVWRPAGLTPARRRHPGRSRRSRRDRPRHTKALHLQGFNEWSIADSNR